MATKVLELSEDWFINVAPNDLSLGPYPVPAERQEYLCGLRENVYEWVQAFQQFLNEHKEWAKARVDVNWPSVEVCSSCHNSWELDPETDECAHCGAEIEEVATLSDE